MMKTFLLVATAVFACMAAVAEDALRSQLELVSKLSDFKPDPNEFRIYFIGDSITRHGFNKEILEKLKWDHIAGMAASSEDKDFAHLVADGVGKSTGKKVKLFFGKGGDAVKALSGLDDAKKYQPNLVVIQLGEHVPSKAFGWQYDDSPEKIEADYATLVDALKTLPSKPLLIGTGLWSPQKGAKAYAGRAAEVDGIQRKVCEAKGIPFASVEKYALDPACSGTGGSGGVKWHPNDAGQAGYAKEILNAFQKLQAEGK